MHALVRALAPLLVVSPLLVSCGGGIEDLAFAKSISISKMECPTSNFGATVPPGTDAKVKAWATIVGIKNADVVWTWDSDGNAVTFGAQTQEDNTSSIDIKAPGSPAKYKINVHAKAEGKEGNATCELEVK
ncbi:hypothetical protein [Viridibacterium curvum]|uniref:Ig-like domain-containing protein n=1 Tax=Viridibacterium curvum TaxID=1101404 RepID=A0ABP9QVQ0_9RHOO